MRVVIIGGTGHVGGYLVPRLVEAGHEVVCITRGRQQPYRQDPAWESATMISADRTAEEAGGVFGERIRDLRPEIVIDMICFTPDSARQLVEALRGQVREFLHCGTIWIHGHSVEVPTSEDQPRNPFGEYGINKAAIEAYLLEEAKRGDFPSTLMHPGHIVGTGWVPLNPAGHFNTEVFARLARGEELALPNLGMETIHHIHADDIAQVFMLAIENWERAIGQSFHVVSPAALTLRGYAELMAHWFGKPANLQFLPWDEWRKTVSEPEADCTWQHIAHSPNCSIAKARRLLGYEPRYTSMQAVCESVTWLIENERLSA